MRGSQPHKEAASTTSRDESATIAYPKSPRARIFRFEPASQRSFASIRSGAPTGWNIVGAWVRSYRARDGFVNTRARGVRGRTKVFAPAGIATGSGCGYAVNEKNPMTGVPGLS